MTISKITTLSPEIHFAILDRLSLKGIDLYMLLSKQFKATAEAFLESKLKKIFTSKPLIISRPIPFKINTIFLYKIIYRHFHAGQTTNDQDLSRLGLQRPEQLQEEIFFFEELKFHQMSDATDTELHRLTAACRLGFERLVETICKQNKELLLRDSTIHDLKKESLYPLHIAAAIGNEVMLQTLIEHLPPEAVFLKDGEGFTPLQLALRFGQAKTVESLLVKRGRGERTAIGNTYHICCYAEKMLKKKNICTEEIENLLNRVIQITKDSNEIDFEIGGDSPPQVAAIFMHSTIALKLFFEHALIRNSYVTLKGKRVSLYDLARYNGLDQELEDYFPNKESTGYPNLWDKARLFLDSIPSRCDVCNIESDLLSFRRDGLWTADGYHLMHQMAKFQVLFHEFHYNEIQAMIAKNIDINLRDKREHRTVLHHICNMIRSLNEPERQLFRVLIESHGANLELKDYMGLTPLNLAVKNGLVVCSRILLQCGANPNTQDNQGNTPVHYAAFYDEDEDSPDFTHNTGIHLLDLLVDSHANINIQNNNGETPLHIASRHGLASFRRALIDYGADNSIFDQSGRVARRDCCSIS